ncbi:hypothetical protein MMC17_005468 [Xylographa soralifera]|nr:hypothetical protein [Xylographa soralifera]
MRLLHTTSYQFKEFFDSQVPKYAILSHRWADVEVSFQDFEDSLKKQSAALDKVLQCCRLARDRGLEWAWIDTCCIDKKSSAELSEAINSMYRWYKKAEVCFAYLSDVHWGSTKNIDVLRTRFRNSVWFRRGWTLQELLAPSIVDFFDYWWSRIGTKESLETEISATTGIEAQYLYWPYSIASACVAKKMSWASRRETTRTEDMAYCLMGLFDVNMPLLYGEGRKAFYRLQLEIINNSDDDSIFAWFADSGNVSGIIAPSPSSFGNSGNIILADNGYEFERRKPHRMTNKGLEFHLPYQLYAFLELRTEYNDDGASQIVFNLGCRIVEGEFIRIRLWKLGGIWYRIEKARFRPIFDKPNYTGDPDKDEFETIYIKNSC